jgi:hypothetical protein
MNVARLTSIAAVLSVAAWLSLGDRVEASEWGCEVLLCASSLNPSWRGVPACHPPMYRLISAMKGWGFSWPTCPEAGTGQPGYEVYDECPAGWSVGSSGQDHGGQDDLCVQVRNTCPLPASIFEPFSARMSTASKAQHFQGFQPEPVCWPPRSLPNRSPESRFSPNLCASPFSTKVLRSVISTA